MAYENLAEKLRKKGWNSDDINNTIRILNDSPSYEKPSGRAMDSAAYWVALFIMIAGNVILSIVLMPTLLVLKSIYLYSILSVVALSFGAMFSILIGQIETLQGKKILAQFFMPALALTDMYYLTTVTNYLSAELHIENTHSPLLISLVYAFSFILPYFMILIKNKVNIVSA